MASVTEDQLQWLTNTIARAVNPKRIILFGSQARGTADDRSDVDLLIVDDPAPSSSWSRRREIGKIRRSIPPMGIPVDVVLFTAEEVGRWKDTTNHVIGDAYREGKVLYERP